MDLTIFQMYIIGPSQPFSFSRIFVIKHRQYLCGRIIHRVRARGQSRVRCCCKEGLVPDLEYLTNGRALQPEPFLQVSEIFVKHVEVIGASGAAMLAQLWIG